MTHKLPEIDLKTLDILNYPDLTGDLEELYEKYKESIKELEDRVELEKAKIIVALDSERDIIGNRQVRRYSSQEVKEAKLLLVLNESLEFVCMNNELNDNKSAAKQVKFLLDKIRRYKQILLIEYQNHGTRRFCDINNGNVTFNEHSYSNNVYGR